MSRLRLHILYEYGSNGLPFGSSHIRLLRPLSHPALHDAVDVTWDLDYEGQTADIVIVDRMWRPDLSLALVERLVEQVRRSGARLWYAVDDDLWMQQSSRDWQMSEALEQASRFLLSAADMVLVTTPVLKERLAPHNPAIQIVQSALDERLLPVGRPTHRASLFDLSQVVIGYMGTRTHSNDLEMVIPALRRLWERHAGQVAYEFVGVADEDVLHRQLAGLPIRIRAPLPEEGEYPLFMLWFTRQLAWDIAISPLADTPFNECKSDIKFLDYCAMGAAAILSKVPAYASTVRHGETGWLVENNEQSWLDGLERLLTDDVVRDCVAGAGHRYLYSERILAHAARQWLPILEQA